MGVIKREVNINLKRCHFCKESQYKVKYLVVGQGTNICDECLALCNEIIEKHKTIEFNAKNKEVEKE